MKLLNECPICFELTNGNVCSDYLFSACFDRKKPINLIVFECDKCGSRWRVNISIEI